MYEVEVKVPASHDAVRAALADSDAECVGTVAQADTYFDAPHRDFAETDEALRVRRVATAAETFERDAVQGGLTAAIDAVLDGEYRAEGESRVTYKGPLLEAESKSREEFETAVGSGEEMREILSRLGFEPAATVRKLRETHHVDDFEVLLDAVEDVGEYVEVETEVESDSEVEAAREDAYALLRQLGLDPADQIRTSYLGLKLADA
ncbi:class IV adenylate cyclase [Halobacterium sp. KA-4]|jgi:adenylate cyclase class 2|uniref:class IV adenylate cyclase n=1 Tax=Halobacterium sp. KA-4 TaxID=2896367 RepID=UPI001E2841A9|nr:class IV adenylate cyclase [Halobacterium sp. KA-4]MCD2199684.1 class IV adenylate cyclase [Halobacterium sp. KA-4]